MRLVLKGRPVGVEDRGEHLVSMVPDLVSAVKKVGRSIKEVFDKTTKRK